MRLLPVLLFPLLLLSAGVAAADIYRHVDARGNVSYSDQAPVSDAEPVELPPLNQMPGHPPPAGSGMPPAVPGVGSGTSTPPPPVITAYESLTLQGITDGATFRDPEHGISLQAVVSPGMRAGDRLLIRHNGVDASDSGSLVIPRLERGTHTFTAVVTDPRGEVVLTSDSVTIHVFRTAVRKKKSP